MKVALIHIRLLNKGGLERRLFNYIRWFRDRGDEVHVFVYKVEEDKIPEGIHLHEVKVRWAPKPFRALLFDRALHKLLPPMQFDFVLSLGRNSCQDAVLVPANHLGYLESTGKKFRGLSDRLQILMDRRAYSAPGVLLPCSEMMQEELETLYHVPREKCVVLYPPSDTEQFHRGVKERRAEMRAKYGFRDGFTSFLFLSTSHERKGLPLLLETFRLLKSEPFELLIAGAPEVKSDLPNVRYLGFISRTEELYAAADVTLVPSLYEPFGQVVSESILCGTPVVVSHKTGAKSVVTMDTGVIVTQFDSAKWAAAVRFSAIKKFPMDGNFASKYGIDLDSHIRRMLNAAGKKL